MIRTNKIMLFTFLFCLFGKIISEEESQVDSNISVRGNASGGVPSNLITFKFQIFAKGITQQRARNLYMNNLNSLKSDLSEFGVDNIRTSDFSVKPSYEDGRDVFIASSKGVFRVTDLLVSNQIKNRLNELEYIKNIKVSFSHSRDAIIKKIEELVDIAISKAEEKAVGEADSRGVYITGVIQTSVGVDSNANILRYATRKERERITKKNGYRLINLSAFITYGTGVFEEDSVGPLSRSTAGKREKRSNRLYSAALGGKGKGSVSDFRDQIRGKLIDQASKKV